MISDGESQAVIEYNCSGGGFGRSKITVITPRSLSIETQGISDNFPFGYKVAGASPRRLRRRPGEQPGPLRRRLTIES